MDTHITEPVSTFWKWPPQALLQESQAAIPTSRQRARVQLSALTTQRSAWAVSCPGGKEDTQRALGAHGHQKAEACCV